MNQTGKSAGRRKELPENESRLSIRLAPEDKASLNRKAKGLGYKDLSAMIRALANGDIEVSVTTNLSMQILGKS
ncbi:ribbon-helix-helix protein, CopG family [Nostoc sp. TCL26-01]|uniref:ribbon-helix-helix protein, CopG family n=1 Tax=Nostoc sp. TCL26-01 TaxID=2576904 RepID=UPI0015BCCC9D|nr:ribbon-helix-helix protein, CopG family [Nostoc sp. TCL26-01]